MIVSELIEKLKTLPQDVEVMIERGEWGPSRLADDPRVAIVGDSGSKTMNWEVPYPELPIDEGDRPRITVVLLD